MASSTTTNGTPKPTLLAFHGSGSNATCHHIQLLRLSKYLNKHFQIEDMNAPFPSAAGPGVLPFFEGMGPYKRWLPLSEITSKESMENGTGTHIMAPEVEDLIRSTVSRIHTEGGKVVGLIGFSQGTKIVAGLLRACEIRRAVQAAGATSGIDAKEVDWLDFHFALSVCGSYPPPVGPKVAFEYLESSTLSAEEKEKIAKEKIRIPTLHMQGLQDEWAWTGKLLIAKDYELGEGMSEVRETNGGHHYPQPTEITEGMAEWASEVWERVEDDLQR
ncbi:citrinin biosynthesis oxidoreductase-like protein CtnB [Pleomassaria siparia CBS 279.74]|uniref:Citrinin biosynthesis oxidoreductase-like protein CtnB n=1 Tax=Pleomassaria siparia CBS 279.74 TaxID=1314801 RepID=A0A6G1KJC7_9PLEO|nr:citrinin biosynthesis oxidoreductase-like protein CtnB [Pleomassaria siparia CBS 279.74]